MTYESADLYIESFDTVAAKILAIDLVIAALITSATKGAAQGDISEYSLDDGQTKIRTAYRDVSDISRAVMNWQRVKQLYMTQLTGRMVRLVDSKNFGQ